MNAKLIACTSAFLLLLNSCSLGFEDIDPREIEDVNESILGKEIGLKFSDTSNLLKFYETDYIIDNSWYAKFEIIESDKDLILNSIEKFETVKYQLKSQPVKGLDWWEVEDPDISKKYRYDNSTIVMLIIKTEKNKVYLYINCIII